MLFGKKTATHSSSNNAVSLVKSKESLERSFVTLSKKTGVNLGAHRARVCVVMDRSGSMYHQYNNGTVQAILTRLLPLALRFDDNGELEVFLFNSSVQQVEPMNIKNYDSYVNNEIMQKGYSPFGGTSYAPPINHTISYYDDGSKQPTFVIFITDGDNSDKNETDNIIRKSSNFPIFYHFIGIGYESFSYLRKLDDLTGRKVDNTAFLKVNDFSNLNDEQLYSKLLEQYIQWLKAMHFI